MKGIFDVAMKAYWRARSAIMARCYWKIRQEFGREWEIRPGDSRILDKIANRSRWMGDVLWASAQARAELIAALVGYASTDEELDHVIRDLVILAFESPEGLEVRTKLALMAKRPNVGRLLEMYERGDYED